MSMRSRIRLAEFSLSIAVLGVVSPGMAGEDCHRQQETDCCTSAQSLLITCWGSHTCRPDPIDSDSLTRNLPYTPGYDLALLQQGGDESVCTYYAAICGPSPLDPCDHQSFESTIYCVDCDTVTGPFNCD